MVNEGPENLFTLKELRQLTGLTKHELKEYIKRGALRIRQDGRKGVLTQKEVLEFLDKVGLEPKWEKLQDRPRSALSGLFSRMAGKRALRTSEVFGFSIFIHVVFLFIFGLVIGLMGHSEVSRFITFSVETTTAMLDFEDPNGQDNSKLVKTKEEVKSSPAKTGPPSQSETKDQQSMPPAPEDMNPETELLPIKARDIKTNMFAAQPLLQKRIAPLEPVLISEMQPAEVGIEPAAETTIETKISKKDSFSNTPAGLIAAKQGPYRPGMGVTPPKLIYKVQPQYPKKAADAGVEGPVELEVVVKADGSVGEIEVLNLPHDGLDFDEAAIEAVQQWKFLPGRFQGKPVDVVAIVAVNFRMEK